MEFVLDLFAHPVGQSLSVHEVLFSVIVRELEIENQLLLTCLQIQMCTFFVPILRQHVVLVYFILEVVVVCFECSFDLVHAEIIQVVVPVVVQLEHECVGCGVLRVELGGSR